MCFWRSDGGQITPRLPSFTCHQKNTTCSKEDSRPGVLSLFSPRLLRCLDLEDVSETPILSWMLNIYHIYPFQDSRSPALLNIAFQISSHKSRLYSGYTLALLHIKSFQSYTSLVKELCHPYRNRSSDCASDDSRLTEYHDVHR